MNRKQRKAATRIFVTVYLSDRAYGGPEEGGWYYDTGEPQAVLGTFHNIDNARDFAEAWREDIDRNDNAPRGSRANLDSVLCDGRYIVRTERHAPQAYPQRRPHYE